MFRREMQELHHKAVDRENPLYVWRAVLKCHVRKQALPKWCLEYLVATAFLLDRLVQQVIPEEQARDHPLPSLSPQQAAERVAQALQITRQGANAFAALRRDSDARSDAALQDLRNVARTGPGWLRARMSKLPKVGDKRPQQTERTARRRVQKGRNLTPKP